MWTKMANWQVFSCDKKFDHGLIQTSEIFIEYSATTYI